MRILAKAPDFVRARSSNEIQLAKFEIEKQLNLQTQFLDPLCHWQCFDSTLPNGEICFNRLEEGETLTSLWKMQVKAKAVSLKNSSRFAQMFHRCNIKMASFDIQFASESKQIPRCAQNATTTFVMGAASSFSRIMSWHLAFFVENHEKCEMVNDYWLPEKQDQDNRWVMIRVDLAGPLGPAVA